MKQIILLLIVVLSSWTLFAQEQKTENIVKGKKVGDVVKGKRVKYIVVGENDYSLYVRNVKNRDSVKRKENIHVPRSMSNKIYEIVYNFLSSEMLSQCIKEENESLDLLCIINKKFKVDEITFSIDKEKGFWRNFPVDQLYKLEKEIIKNVEIDVRERTWVTEKELGEQYFCALISAYMLRGMLIKKEKEALENAKAKI